MRGFVPFEEVEFGVVADSVLYEVVVSNHLSHLGHVVLEHHSLPFSLVLFSLSLLDLLENQHLLEEDVIDQELGNPSDMG